MELFPSKEIVPALDSLLKAFDVQTGEAAVSWILLGYSTPLGTSYLELDYIGRPVGKRRSQTLVSDKTTGRFLIYFSGSCIPRIANCRVGEPCPSRKTLCLYVSEALHAKSVQMVDQ
jgi:hypothetical protein